MTAESQNLQKIATEGNPSNSSLVPVVETTSFPCLLKVNSSCSRLKFNPDYNASLLI